MADGEHVLLLVIHHIVADGWSERILLRDLSACYLAVREGRPPQLAPVAVQPADFAVWEAQQIASGDLDAALARVRTRLSGTRSRAGAAPGKDGGRNERPSRDAADTAGPGADRAPA